MFLLCCVYVVQDTIQCVSGCVCPAGLLLDGKGGCVKEEQCPCSFNGMLFSSGQSINVKCNKW